MSKGINSQYDAITQELRRGLLVLAVLSQLQKTHYGYALINKMSEMGLQVEQGTLYPLLRRLETQGLLESQWKIEGSRPRRYYIISHEGQEILEKLAVDWKSLVEVMDGLLSKA